jgi:hypothetical protein
MSKQKPTIEQMKGLDKFKQGHSFKVMAFAGTGKTTTLVMMANDNKNKKGIYLAFNKKMADEASRKFPDNVECKTFHSLAYRNTPNHILRKVSSQRIYPRDIVNLYSLRPVRLQGRSCFHDFSANLLANFVLNTIKNFCKTSSKCLDIRHFHQTLTLKELEVKDELTNLLFPIIHQHWLRMIGDNDFPIDHDIYLKLWEMSNPQLDCDFILVDEAQDSDPTSVSIVYNQKDKQVLYVGDKHQQIYTWRGATNVMQTLPLEAIYLTQSFRFGDAVAETANLILKRVLGEKNSIKGNKKLNSRVFYNKTRPEKLDAYISRTNGVGFGRYIDQVSANIPVDLLADKTKILDFLKSADALKFGHVQNFGELRGFQSWTEVIEHIKVNHDTQLGAMVRLSDNYSFNEVQAILEKGRNFQKNSSLILTAHKSKGLEYDNVELGNDFQYKIDKEILSLNSEEARLLYVAVTRAKQNLYANGISDLLMALQKGYRINLNKE